MNVPIPEPGAVSVSDPVTAYVWFVQGEEPEEPDVCVSDPPVNVPAMWRTIPM